MKKFALSTLMMLSLCANSSQAANLYSSNLGSGLSQLGGLSAVNTGIIRFGVFTPGFDFAANSEDFEAMDAAFTEVYSRSGAISVSGSNGFFDISHSYDATASFGGIPYDNSIGSTNDVAGDIAGEKVYIWVLNNTDPAVATQQAIFSTSQRWADGDDLVPDTLVNPDADALELVAHLGTLSNGGDIGAGVASHSMSGALIPVAGVIATVTPATPKVLVGTRVVFDATVTEGTPPLFYQWRKDGSDIVGATNARLTIASVGIAGRGEYDCVVRNTAGSTPSNVIDLNVVTAKPSIITAPVAAIVPSGGTISLSLEAVGAGNVRYQWKKSSTIAGATTDTLSIPGAKLSDAGSYSCTISNTPGAGTGSITASTRVVVVDQTERTVVGQIGKTASLQAVAAGTGITKYEWFLASDLINPIINSSKYAGATTKTLTVKALDLLDTDGYVCRISMGTASQTTGIQELVVYNTAPALATVNLPVGIVGGVYGSLLEDGTYGYIIPRTTAENGANIAESFSASPLPKGLTLDAKAGIIRGIPTVAAETQVTVRASNKVGPSAPQTVPLLINSFPTGIAGAYVGPVDRVASLGADLGGRVDLLISPTGVISGKLYLGAASHSVAGKVNVSGTISAEASVSAEVNVPRKGSTPVKLSFDVGSGLLTEGEISDATEATPVPFEGWRYVWAAKPVTANATSYAGRYNVALGLTEEDEDFGTAGVPQGMGYATFTVKADGKLSFTGKYADGSSVTGSTFVGPQGQAFIFHTLYSGKGSFLGDFAINTMDDTDPANNQINDGTASWSRPANTSKTNKLYRDGFLFDLNIKGGSFRAPASATLLGLTAGSIADLKFTQANIGTALQQPDAAVTIKVSNGLTVTPTVAAAKTKLTPTASTGAFKGSFEAVAKKATSFTGLIVPIEGVQTGVGYFLLDQSGTPATQQSGAVIFERRITE